MSMRAITKLVIEVFQSTWKNNMKNTTHIIKHKNKEIVQALYTQFYLFLSIVGKPTYPVFLGGLPALHTLCAAQ